MNPAKEKLLYDTYEKFMKISMNKLPVELLDGITAENIMAYGTALDEKLLSIQDCRELVMRQLEQGSGFKFKQERIPQTVIISPEEDSAIFIEEMKLKIISKEYTHRLFLRITTVLEYSDKKWKVVHFHTSKPDDISSETDTWHINEWKRKNEELQKLVDEKTADLKEKNRDLEIEASLERVRTVAMSMNKSEDLLNICENLFNELKNLGFDELRNTMINIHNDEEKTFLNYDYSDTLGKTITPLYYNINPVIAKQIKQIRKSRDAFSETSFTGDELKEWKKFRKRKGEPDDPRLKNTKALYYYFYSIGTGSIGISTFGSVTKEKLELLKRFRNVFEFSYRRYLDVMQAEEQAKEAKIEASLERVRAMALSMRSSGELLGVCEILYKELQKLGFKDLRNAQILINNDEKKYFLDYDYSDTAGTSITNILYDSHPKITTFIRKLRKSKDAFAEIVIAGKEMKTWKEFRRNNGEAPDPRIDNTASLHYYFYSIGKGAIGISAFESISKDELEILKRFRNVFDFAYRRYSDVAKAEVQAKEARLEASLERVRAQAMSISKPEQLSSISEIIFAELKKLGFDNLRNTEIIINNENKESVLSYYYSDYGVTETIEIFYNDHPKVKLWAEEMQRADDAFILIEIPEKEMKAWKKYRTDIGYLPDPKLNKAKSLFYYSYSIGPGALSISVFKPVTDEQLLILERFKNVFGLAYRRYADVALAEAQAREAKIEMALERVRSRTMAMQKSEELTETSSVLFQQFQELGINPEQVSIASINETEKTVEVSATLHGNKFPKCYKVSIDEMFIREIYDVWRKKLKSATIVISGKRLKSYNKWRNKLIGQHLFETARINNEKWIINFATFSKGGISLSSNEHVPAETIQLLERFAGVFDLTYTRFLDLQKAEEQAREAQIELALERIRARSMAMHKSEELVDASVVLFNELKSLGIESIRTGVGIFDESKEAVEIWSSQLIEEKRNKILGVVPFKSHPFFELNYKAWKRKEAYFFYEIAGKEVKKYYNVMSSVLSYPEKKEFNPKECFYTFFFPDGSLNVVSKNNLTEDECNLMLRFAKVFGMIYRRFLDLQKAEAQAREAQIGLALERVRARTMSMHKSDELAETAAVMFQQLMDLGIDAYRLYIGIIENEKKKIEFWATDYGGSKISSKYTADVNGSRVFKNIYNEWKNNKKYVIVDPKGKDLTDHLRYLSKIMFFPVKDEKVLKRRLQTIFYFSKGLIGILTNEELSNESINIISRFAGVFDLTYRRFLDLQISEAQTREAQIEVALERVRSRTMAMHGSNELQEAAVLLFQQIRELGVDTGSCGYVIWENENKDATVWMSSAEGGIQDPFKLSHTKSKIYKEIYSAKEEGKEFIAKEVRGAELKKHFDYLTTVPGIGEKIKQLRKSRYRFPETIVYNIAFFKHGYLSFHTYAQNSDAHDIFRRFAIVFEQTYTRFLDLLKAEAQAKEAQIELGLERVRTRAMAMQKSDELSELVDTVFKELTKLDFALTWCIINIIDESSMSNTVWAANPDINKAPESYQMFFEDYPFHHAMMKGWKERKAVDVYVLEGPEKKVYDEYLFNETEFRRVPAEAQAVSRAMEKYVVTFSFSNFGGLQTVGDNPLSEANKDILSRFGKVFDLTYTRFNDLKLAEAQAAEAKIEAALERVRSRTMGMQKSEELKELIQVVLEQFVHLNINAEHAGFVMDYKARDDYNIWVADPLGVPSQVTIPYFDSVYYNSFNEAKEKGLDFFATKLSFKEKNAFYKKLFKYIPGLPEEAKEFYFSCPGLAVSTVLLENVGLYIENFSGTLYTDEENNTLMRFGKVFQQTYTRFLDLQKAEEQAREAKIEAAMERTRTQSMIMQHSNELDDTLRVFHEQVLLLGIQSEFSFLWLPDEEKDRHIFWVTWLEKGKDSTVFKSKAINYPLDRNEPATAQCMVDWKSDEAVHSYNIPPAGVKNYFSAWSELFKGAEQLKPKYFMNGLYYVEAFMKYGCFGVMTKNELSGDEKKILLRFAIEFERTYTRFLDLQKAEAQAREAQIEAALERVRSKTMAMHNSPEVGETVAVMFDELRKLGIETYRCGIGILDETKEMEVWTAKPYDKGKAELVIGYLDMRMHPLLKGAIENWKKKKDSYYYHLKGKDLINYFNAINKHDNYPAKYNFETLPQEIFHHDFYFREGTLFVFTLKQLTSVDESTLKRFAGVFGQTYRRYLDLQKAEAQAREAQIEAALERVRGKAMAMHNSADLTDAAGKVFAELNNLGIKLIRTGFVLLSKDSRIAKLYPATSFDNKNTVAFTGEFEFTGHPIYEKQYESWQKKENYFPVLEGDVLKSYYKILSEGLSVPFRNFPTDKKQYGTFLPFSEGFLFTWSDEPYSENEINILDRFKNILDLTIRRYIDLKNAEAQSRESQIEASLERVRSKAMAMQTSDDLGNAVATIFEELDKLNLGTLRCGIGILDRETRSAEAYAALKTDEGMVVQVSANESMDIHPLLHGAFEAWLNQENYSYILEGKNIADYYAALEKENFILPDSLQLENEKKLPRQYYFVATFQFGGLFAFSETEFTDEATAVIKRFADVINFTYTRFNDLKQSEAQTREAQIETALERVRSRTLAMQKSDELAETAAVVFRQLINLGIEPNRLYIGIINDDSGDIEAWATDEDGTKVSREFTLNIYANASVKKMYEGWVSKKKSIIIDMQGKELESYLHYISDVLNIPFKGGLAQDRRVQNIAYFSKGFIGVASHDPQPDETALLLERFAAVFNLTFTRFNDLQIAERHAEQAELDLIKLQTEKKRAEEALTELRSTQAQLIQSEKMASLGELTAGIAHEIQNPLNFVNNFSEVNTELIDELNQEIEKGNIEEAAAIAKDIKDNEEKIKHHGKRAEGIVKGMLQHSRSSSGVKESVNINALADEYLRLAYHGLRAKDKTFNAKMETDFDESIGEMNVVPQDIGRVILNLITNAFYAVTEKKKEEIKGFEPTVTVSSRKSGENVTISVKDNGGGIPKKVMDKIFQPFFTTKPTGLGTGLGLSMSYDIIKAHGGELKVETKEGEGAEFILLLPLSEKI